MNRLAPALANRLHETRNINNMDISQVFPLGWTHYLIGGLLIGAGVALLFALTGLIGGMSTVFTSTWSYVSRTSFFRQPRFMSSRRWRLLYALGLVIGAFAVMPFVPMPVAPTTIPWWQLAVGGVLVGYGARMSNGCTSGHGICGMASLQASSMLAVVVFLSTAMLASRVVLMIGGH